MRGSIALSANLRPAAPGEVVLCPLSAGTAGRFMRPLSPGRWDAVPLLSPARAKPEPTLPRGMRGRDQGWRAAGAGPPATGLRAGVRALIAKPGGQRQHDQGDDHPSTDDPPRQPSRHEDRDVTRRHGVSRFRSSTGRVVAAVRTGRRRAVTRSPPARQRDSATMPWSVVQPRHSAKRRLVGQPRSGHEVLLPRAAVDSDHVPIPVRGALVRSKAAVVHLWR